MSGQVQINVPYPTSKLEIETLTFRDKLKPGTDETWSFKIKGHNNEKASAELLASMYDASLEQFKAHNWQFNPYQPQNYRSYYRYNANHSFGTESFRVYQKYNQGHTNFSQRFDRLNWFGLNIGNTNIILRGYSSISSDDEVVVTALGVKRKGASQPAHAVGNYLMEEKESMLDNGYDDVQVEEDNKPEDTKQQDFSQVSIRKNLQETAFFFPQLKTNKEGDISFNFTTPEALTKWNLNLLAHNKKGEFDKKTLTAVTQKELMVLPNAPRFLREGDIITISSKIANLTDKTLNGQAVLQLFDALTNKPIDARFSQRKQ